MRVDYTKQSATLYKKYLEVTLALKHGSIAPALLHLVDLRVSQINNCAFCIDMHSKQAKIGGERELRLYHLQIWRESPLFTPRERAALQWAEALTQLSPHGVPDETYNEVHNHLTEQEISDLTFAIMMINGWNRVSIGFQVEPGSQDTVYGLTKAGLN